MLSPQNLMLIMAGFVILMAWWANSSKRDKILCRFRRPNKTLVVRWVKMKSRFVVFDNRKYDVLPSCIVFQWYTAGIVHMLFPQFVATLDFTSSSRWPLNPNTMKYDLDDPAIRQSLNKEEWVESYVKGARPNATKTKQGMIEKYLPWFALIAVVLVGFWLYQNQQALSKQLAVLFNTVNSLKPK